MRQNDANETRTRDTTVKGWCLNHLTMAPHKGEDRIRTGDQGVADPRLTTWLLRRKTPKSFRSSSWTRTNDTAVNSRVLYRLSYRGINKYPSEMDYIE